MNSLTTFQLGDLQLKNKIVMAPMTRTRATNYIPNKIIAEYYGQRASAGLIITEGTSPSANGLGYPRIPGAYSDAQIKGWKDVADAVHTKGGKIFVQVMHTGRISAQINMPEGATIIAPSAIQAAGQIFSETGMVDHGMPKEMTKDDILKTQDEYVYASERLINEAGIDGVELHAANGYLLDQFINPKSNHRNDEYGGSVENRNRFVIETAQKVADTVGANKVGIRISPFGVYNDLQSDYEDVEETFIALAKELKDIGLVYMHIVVQEDSFGVTDARTDRQLNLRKAIKNTFEGTVITGGNVSTIATADAVLNEGFDLAYVGRPYISNPDFIERLKNKVALQAPNPETFFGIDAVGFTDYAFA
ncbi:alkene reductase [Flavobacteriales bacterium 34_180_T64]|nr:alkene reductase [Flavobacteriales bacterium 34_180_T64]